jgi:hypothetical protein
MTCNSTNPDARGPKIGQEQDTCDLSLISPSEFFEKNLPKLLQYCHSRWNGYGEDVLNQAVKQGMKYEYMTFSLFGDLCHSAARDLKIARWQHTAEGTVILPPTRRHPKEAMKCESCGGTRFTDTLGYQLMCVCCGEKVDPPSPILDPGEDEDPIDDEKITEIEKNTLHPQVQAVLKAVLDGQNIVEATKKAGISYHEFRKKARQAYLQPSLFPCKNSTPDTYMSGGAR